MEAGFSRKFQRRRIKKNLSWLWTLEFAKKIRNIHVELKILRPWKFFLSFHDTVAIWSRTNSTGKDIRPHLSIKGENVEDPSWHRSLRKEGGEIHRGGKRRWAKWVKNSDRDGRRDPVLLAKWWSCCRRGNATSGDLNSKLSSMFSKGFDDPRPPVFDLSLFELTWANNPLTRET